MGGITQIVINSPATVDNCVEWGTMWHFKAVEQVHSAGLIGAPVVARRAVRTNNYEYY